MFVRSRPAFVWRRELYPKEKSPELKIGLPAAGVQRLGAWIDGEVTLGWIGFVLLIRTFLVWTFFLATFLCSDIYDIKTAT